MDSRPVLVVEDDAIVRRLIVACLHGEGHACIAVGDAESAIEAAARTGFAAALVDNRLPGMRGTELIGRLHDVDPTLPVLLVTADADVGDRVRGLDAGAVDYLVKPFDPEELLARLRAQLRNRQAWVQVMQDRLARRGTVVRALAGLDPSKGVRSVARAVCETVLSAREADGAGLVRIGDDGDIELLAVLGALDDRRCQRWARTTLALRARVAEGPWVEPLPVGPGLVACAPVRCGHVATAVLLLAFVGPPAGETGAAQRALGAATDFAAMAANLLDLATETELDPSVSATGVDLDGLTSVFQPLVELASGQTVGWEALARFGDATPPLVRLAQASAAGRRQELEMRAADRAVAEARGLPGEEFLAINVSPALVLERHMDLSRLLEEADRPVVVELTEHEPVADYPALRRALRILGARVSVDDAGAGFATLRHVMVLEPDFVKLDRSWVAGIDRDPARQALAAGIAHFARVIGASLVAEGVETEAELAWLSWLEVDLAQGFLLGQPAPAPSWA